MKTHWLTSENIAGIAARFWPKVDRRGDEECWPWLATRNVHGYGLFWAAGQLRTAQRVAFALTHPATPLDGYVCHACDNPICVNPAHLWLGSASDNHADMRRKGRHPKLARAAPRPEQSVRMC